MLQRVLMLGVGVAILVSAVLINLSILDVVSVSEMKETLGKTLSVIAVSSVALLLIAVIIKIGGTRGRPK